MKVRDYLLAAKNKKRVSKTQRFTKAFVWIMLIAMLGSGFLSVLYTLITMN
ncbi:DUF4044 domain-containing protein [Carnobacterium pleistocenium]|uniref:DUF4044 domain-containing protein n=1 Tax=Carnobacterium pleistocenium TaxID=181073 RepID=UPI0012EC8834|nr:DUF4044 domain-containing protein [Carnobacterium pleistocenium]